jgi:hypothetical protein
MRCHQCRRNGGNLNHRASTTAPMPHFDERSVPTNNIASMKPPGSNRLRFTIK